MKENQDATEEMRSKVAIAVICVFAFAVQAFANNPVGAKIESCADRYFVSKVLEAKDLVFSKEIAKTTFAFEFAAGDFIQIGCDGCAEWLDRQERGIVSVQLTSKLGNREMSRADLDQWIVLPQGGKVAVVFQRDGYGERLLHLKALTVLRKSLNADVVVAGKTIGLVEVHQLCLPKIESGIGRRSTCFFLDFKGLDHYQVKVVDGNGSQEVEGYVFKSGEEFAKKPIVFDSVAEMPSIDDAGGLFGFEFAEPTEAKGLHFYHIDIDRIPARSAGESSTLDK